MKEFTNATVRENVNFQSAQLREGMQEHVMKERTVQEYIIEFEELKSFMLERVNKVHSEEYFVESFISGLKPDIRQMLELLKPQSLMEAMQLAKIQENRIGGTTREYRQPNKPHIQSNSGLGRGVQTETGGIMKGRANYEKLPPLKKLTTEELETRRRKNLCFNCDEPFHLGHKCKKLFVIVCDEPTEAEEVELREENDTQEEYHISVNALVGQLAPDTIKVVGLSGKKQITILVDTGSTHSFLDPGTAKKLGCIIEFTTPMMLGGCDMVVGVDFLRLGPITFDFVNHKIQFQGPQGEVILEGVKKEVSLSMMSGKEFKRMVTKGRDMIYGCICFISEVEFQEVALGLELGNRPFLWVVRQDITSNVDYAYPKGFKDRVHKRGLMVSWAPQQQVLSHPSIACFISHCGWNSTIEGISNGVPFLCWPFLADQFANQTYICDEWKIGLGLSKDENGIIRKREIKDKLEHLLTDKSYKERALNLQDKIMDSIRGGSSHKNFNKFIEWIKDI
ncbi:hypothetical protein DH2020_037109 [Rehmannia glutinosa]|uniref:Uncharacterized protein n=1 Tax=Rehmannia glutinosa TaxID=99300 RepID=A0ABR0V4X7_REHGL